MANCSSVTKEFLANKYKTMKEDIKPLDLNLTENDKRHLKEQERIRIITAEHIKTLGIPEKYFGYT